MSLDRARAVADAVLYEGYLLYPYRATSSKNQSRWQSGVLGPPGAAAAVWERSRTCPCRAWCGAAPMRRSRVHLRFLQLQARGVEAAVAGEPDRYAPVAELRAGARTWMSWDEAVAHEIELGPCVLSSSATPVTSRSRYRAARTSSPALREPGPQVVGRLVRRRRPLTAVVRVSAVATPEDPTLTSP